MKDDISPRPDFSARLSFWLLICFLTVLWVAGGASRADVLGQSVVRLFAWGALITFTLLSTRFEWRSVQPIAFFLGLSIVLVALQLIPLPPAVWTTLPGRQLFKEAAAISGQVQPWRPLSISPGATANALGSLIVPVVVLVLSAQLTKRQHLRIMDMLLAMVFGGSLLALLQFSGARFDNPFTNDVHGFVSGNFANRNHFALFVAIGCLLTPVWSFRDGAREVWKVIVCVALLAFFLLVALATGSRTGLVLSVLAIVAGGFLVRNDARRTLRTMPRWAVWSILILIFAALCAVVALSFGLGRAVALDRVLNLMEAEDMRSLALPYIVDMLLRYFPAGSGFGTFDAAFRIIEPDQLLNTQYLNRAHNDWLEVIVDGGLAGAAIVLAAVAWFLLASFRAWKKRGSEATVAQTGAVALLLPMIASIPDYPARTPLIMAVVVIAAVWLLPGSVSTSTSGHKRPRLP